MEINLKELSTQAVESTTGTKKMRLSENAQSMVFQLFTKNVYSNAIGTVVREITSNCFDSHIEAKVNSPVIIRKSVDNQTNTTYISFIDYGVGMSPDRVENIYGVYFESTKRADNTQIGGFGIGGKTPLAYKRSTGNGEGEYDNSFYVITNYNGTRYYYCIYEGAETPMIAPLHSESTTERNGTEIRIPILKRDISDFKKEMVRQLYYFENIIFEGFNTDEDNTNLDKMLTNEYQIIRGKSFLFRGTDYNTNVHVCLGRVAYPIDYNVLGLNYSDYKLPIAIRLEVGEIGVTVSRENLDYSENTIKVLKKKLEEVKAEILQILTKQYDNIVTLEDYFKVKNKFGHVYFPNGKDFYVGDMIKQKDVNFANFKFNSLNMPNDKQLFEFFFDCKLYGKKESSGRKYRYNQETSGFKGSYEGITNNKNLYYFEGQFERKLIKQAWLKSENDRYYMISKKDIADKFLMSDISSLFNVHDLVVDENGLPTKYTKQLQKLQNEYFAIIKRHCTDYNTIEVPADFIMQRKRNVLSNEIRNTTIPVKIADSYHRYRMKLDSLFKLKCPIIYGTKDDENRMNETSKIYGTLFSKNHLMKSYSEYSHEFNHEGKKQILFIIVSQGNMKYLEHCHNAFHVKQIGTRLMYRKENAVIEFFQTQKFIDKFNQLHRLYTCSEFSRLSPSWTKKITPICDAVKKFESNKVNRWDNYSYELAHFFPAIRNIVMTKEQQKYVAIIEEGLEMQEINKDVFCYINTPYNFNNAHDTFWNILKKVLVY